VEPAAPPNRVEFPTARIIGGAGFERNERATRRSRDARLTRTNDLADLLPASGEGWLRNHL
jgi:hypothetical protein